MGRGHGYNHSDGHFPKDGHWLETNESETFVNRISYDFVFSGGESAPSQCSGVSWGHP